ncbi:MAG: hypothetical protein M3450_02510 [Actinomycetota bacterium]|nr:hypothetical protein [Actinomycetota bacterium]
MAAVSVFVDDAVRGRLPLVCAKTGEPADLVIRIQKPIGSGVFGAAWLLVFLGPPGWAALFLVSILGPAPEYLTVRIPETNASYYREKQLERFRLAALIAAISLPLCGLLLLGNLPALWLALGAASLVAALSLHLIIQRQSIGISLDASRRWVTLTGVHPHFVDAVKVQEVGRLGLQNT